MDSTEPTHILRHWDARQYLDYYYGHPKVPKDEADMFRFIAGGLRDIGRRFERALDLGCGPVLHHAAQAVRWADRLDMADVEPSNLGELRQWLDAEPGAFDWSEFIGGADGVLDAEGERGATPDDQARALAARVALMRERIHLISCDLRSPTPLGKPAQYPLVMSYYCTEWVVPSSDGWLRTMRHVTSCLAPGGWLFLAGVHDTEYCMINGHKAYCARITTDGIRGALADNGFDPSTLQIEVTPGLRPQESGIQGTFMAYAQRAG